MTVVMKTQDATNRALAATASKPAWMSIPPLKEKPALVNWRNRSLRDAAAAVLACERKGARLDILGRVAYHSRGDICDGRVFRGERQIREDLIEVLHKVDYERVSPEGKQRWHSDYVQHIEDEVRQWDEKRHGRLVEIIDELEWGTIGARNGIVAIAAEPKQSLEEVVASEERREVGWGAW